MGAANTDQYKSGGILEEITLYQTGGENVAKNKKNPSKNHNTALPKADMEFAEERGNGLEKVALKALKSHNK